MLTWLARLLAGGWVSYAGSGIIQTGGTVSVAAGFIYTGSGGIVASGAGAFVPEYDEAAAGSAVASGIAARYPRLRIHRKRWISCFRRRPRSLWIH
jgi:hypothetical protein